jgi:carboxymethylenebutenolidase
VAIRGGELVSEHMYWDEASVLMQIGLLDPKLLPKKLKSEGLKQLPVVGAGAAEQLLEPKQNRYSRLLQAHDLMD